MTGHTATDQQLQHQRGLTEPAAGASIDQACRMLRLPTIRGQFVATADAAEREQLTYRGFLAELLMAECEDRQRRRPNASRWSQPAH